MRSIIKVLLEVVVGFDILGFGDIAGPESDIEPIMDRQVQHLFYLGTVESLT